MVSLGGSRLIVAIRSIAKPRPCYTQSSTCICSPAIFSAWTLARIFWKAFERLWKHNPLQGIGTINPSCQTVYAKPDLNGVMDPLVLARMKNIIFDIEPNWQVEALETKTSQQTEGDQAVRDRSTPILFVNENLTVNLADEAIRLAYYRRSTISPVPTCQNSLQLPRYCSPSYASKRWHLCTRRNELGLGFRRKRQQSKWL